MSSILQLDSQDRAIAFVHLAVVNKTKMESIFTMLCLDEVTLSCPYCGERVSVLIDCSQEHETIIEDCEVCCRPMNIYVDAADDKGMGRLYVYTEEQLHVGETTQSRY